MQIQINSTLRVFAMNVGNECLVIIHSRELTSRHFGGQKEICFARGRWSNVRLRMSWLVLVVSYMIMTSTGADGHVPPGVRNVQVKISAAGPSCDSDATDGHHRDRPSRARHLCVGPTHSWVVTSQALAAGVSISRSKCESPAVRRRRCRWNQQSFRGNVTKKNDKSPCSLRCC